jgi:hypothetical protein
MIMLAGPERDQSKSKATDQVDFEESAGSSGDEYTPAVNKDDGESEIDESDDLEADAEVEDEADENDKKKTKTRKGKKPKPARADIIAKRNVSSATASQALTSTAHTETKRKAR